MSGVTSTGFEKKTQSEIESELKVDQAALVSNKLNFLPTSTISKLNGIFSDKLREGWDVIEAVYRAFHPDYASYDALDHVSAITGTKRRKPEKSTVTLDRVLLDAGSTIEAGSIVSVGENGGRFVTLTDLTNSTLYKGLFSVNAIAQEYGPKPGYATTIDVIVTPKSGWEAKGTVIGTNTETFNLDGTALQYQTEGMSEDAMEVIAFSGGDPWSLSDVLALINGSTDSIEAFDAGGVIGISSTKDGENSYVLIYPTGGATTVLGLTYGLYKGMNSDNAAVGRDIETDPELRLRREQSLRVSGSAMVDAIRSNVLQLDFIEQCRVFDNDSDLTDGDGLPPKSVEVVAYYTTTTERKQLVAESIFEKLSAGIYSHGSISNTVEDQQGFEHTIRHSISPEVPIYISATLTIDSALYPADGDTQVKNALVALGEQLEMGADVIALKYKSVPLNISGVVDVPTFLIDDVYPPVDSSNIEIDARSIAKFSTGTITISTTIIPAS